jgi:parallel beta-helix repeat protein
VKCVALVAGRTAHREVLMSTVAAGSASSRVSPRLSRRCRWAASLSILAIGFYLAGAILAADRTPVKIAPPKTEAAAAFDYPASHALLIANDDYANWHDLEATHEELATVARALLGQGFTLHGGGIYRNLTGAELRQLLEEFFNACGRGESKKANRLLVFFAGHGATVNVDEIQRGFLLGVDAPKVNPDAANLGKPLALPPDKERSFYAAAAPMTLMRHLAEEADARHVLFCFDSCFAGMIFRSRGAEAVDGRITPRTGKPARLFLTAGDLEEVPAESVFAPYFARGIAGEADADRDGYVTGAELSRFLEPRVHEQARTTVRFGPLPNVKFDQGDIVFRVRPPVPEKVPVKPLVFGKPNQSAPIIVPDDFATIQEAIDAARPGNTVLVRPGVYRESLVLKDGVQLVGTDAASCRIEMVPGAAAMLTALDCRSGTIEKLTFDGRGIHDAQHYGAGWHIIDDDDSVLGTVLTVSSGSPAERAEIPVGSRILAIDGRQKVVGDHYVLSLGGRQRTVEVKYVFEGVEKRIMLTTELCHAPGVWPDGIALLDSRVEVVGCVVHRVGGTGIIVEGTASHVTLRGNTCRDNGGAGIVFKKGATGIVRENVCEKNQWSGFQVSVSNAKMALTQNASFQNRHHGFVVTSAAFDAKDNRAEGNGGAGFCVREAGLASTLETNTAFDNVEAGILIRGGAPMRLMKNICRGNRSSGIVASYGAKVTLVENVSHANAEAGFWMHGKGTDARLSDNTAGDNGTSGIAFGTEATGSARGNRCEANTNAGILVARHAAATLSSNTVSSNRYFGIIFESGAGGNAQENTVRDNEGGGILLQGHGTDPNVTGNKITANTGNGVAIENDAAGVVKENICERNTRCGIRIQGPNTAPQVTGNRCNRNQWGIALDELSAKARVSRNTAQNNGESNHYRGPLSQ